MEVKLPIGRFVNQCSLTDAKKLNHQLNDFSSTSLQAPIVPALPHTFGRQMLFPPMGEFEWPPCLPDASW